MNERPHLEQALNGLKDFQRNSVDHAFHQLYLSDQTSGRFLVADEVGLGKTMIAKGIIAKAIDHLWDVEDRIDILYICSNADIARQNIQRLRLNRSSESKFVFATRSTLLPVTVHELQKNKVNYISLTPHTSFEMKSSLGMWEERVLLYWLLREEWNLQGWAPMNVLQGDVADKDNFRYRVHRYLEDRSIDKQLQEAFLKDLSETTLKENFLELCEIFRYAKDRTRYPREWQQRQSEVIGELRAKLAISSLSALNPDLIIMDEFQRFKHLFDEETEAGSLASGLFQQTERKQGTKILLLSATPYKMYTLYQESDTDDHYRDFLDTLKFLFKNEQQARRVESLLLSFRKEVYQLHEPGGLDPLRTIKTQLENELRKVMVRTERLAATEDRNGMLTQIHSPSPELQSAELSDYVLLQSIAEVVEDHDVLEYWKTAPYLLNVMDDYQLKKRFVQATQDESRGPLLIELMNKNQEMLLSLDDLQKYEPIDPRNMRLREFTSEMDPMQLWKLLWLPPSIPYYHLSGCFEGAGSPTKRLIFSSWRVVPKVLAGYLSYEAERQMMLQFDPTAENTTEARARRRGLLQFAFVDNRLTGMPIFTMLYPCQWLATAIDPLRDVGSHSTVTELKQRIMPVIRDKVCQLKEWEQDSTQEDEAWYWAAPILLDRLHDPEGTQTWWEQPNLATLWKRDESGDEEGSKWVDHVEEVRALLRGERSLKKIPANLTEVLCDMALGGPAVCAFRGLMRFQDGDEWGLSIRNAAAQIGWSFRSLYNVPEVMGLLRGQIKIEPYWRKALLYGVDGCLQSVLDEYFHLLLEGFGGWSEDAMEDLAGRLGEVLTLRTTSLSADEVRLTKRQVKINKNAIRLRARFAQRFGDEQGENGEKTRATQVRDAFNSPFWPFVLTTTSVGQEGLDFHPYCHAIVHWDLPSNPVDLEQREGRVYRYKGHAVRKNIVKVHATKINKRINPSNSLVDNPWPELFNQALLHRGEGENELVPFWLYPLEEGAKIERHVFAHTLSKDYQKLNALRRSLAVYRMVVGQPRQEDLIQFMLAHFDEETVKRAAEELRIDLSPMVKREEQDFVVTP